MVELSKQLGDYHSGTATSNGAAGGTTIVDTGLMAKQNDWITDVAYDRITSGTYDEQERSITSLNNTNGTLTVLAHGGQILSAVTYEVHRLWTASEKRTALVYAARHGFPYINNFIKVETRRAGNWLLNGDMETWAAATVPDNWTRDTVTAAKNTTKPYYLRGTGSLKLSTAAGNISQSATQNSVLNDLAGKTVTIRARGWCNTASCLRLQIYDGTTTTNSDYHSGDSSWDEPELQTLEAEVQISSTPSEVTFRIAHDKAGGISYVDDVRVISGTYNRVYVGDLSLANNRPFEVFQTQEESIYVERWARLTGGSIEGDGYLYLPHTANDARLRINGIGYLDFLDTNGASGADWADTINMNSPQTDILVAEAAIHLYEQALLPQATSGSSDDFKVGLAYWQLKLREARLKFGMPTPQITKNVSG